MGLVQGLALGTSPLVCTRILHRNSSRRDPIFWSLRPVPRIKLGPVAGTNSPTNQSIF